ncbi:hypothetical protein IPC279_21130 [Pseudomonas aeruginosa]|nr:hypothetical protein IPC279_21130 [Pseudomonas aeruginosa]
MLFKLFYQFAIAQRIIQLRLHCQRLRKQPPKIIQHLIIIIQHYQLILFTRNPASHFDAESI